MRKSRINSIIANRRHAVLITVCAACLYIFSGCTGDRGPSSPTLPATYSYTVHIPAMHKDSVSVTLAIEGGTEKPLKFILPFIYADNPYGSSEGTAAGDISVIDAEQNTVSFDTAAQMFGPAVSQVLTLSQSAEYPLTINYKVKVDADMPDTSGSRPPTINVFLNSEDGVLFGSHIFIVPYAALLVDVWRDRRDITLSFDLGDNIELAGVPSSETSYRNTYELIFVQIMLGAQRLLAGSGGGQSFEFYGWKNDVHSPAGLQNAATGFSAILNEIVPIYGSLCETEYHLFFLKIQGGHEGTFSFVCKPPDDDGDSTLGMVMAHEAIHDFVGIRCGDRDDPWWKEGTTYYLGYATASRLGLVSKEKVRRAFADTLDLSDPKFNHAPSSDYVRDNLFSQGLYKIVYDKGGQISMLLDLRVREASENGKRLDDLVAELARRFDGSAFCRRDLTGLFFVNGVLDAQDVLRRYADTPDEIPLEERQEAFERLDGFGAFGP